MKASILAVGTELTNGQIVNRNAATIASKLSALGVQTIIHLTVPDDRKLILQSLRLLEKESEIIFVTGGLGPTSDDFTRDVIAAWTQTPLQFDDASWQHISQRLAARGVTAREIQKQQCYYPEGSKVLLNREGTANAFQLQHEGKSVFVLPGPPREIEAIWSDHIAPWLKSATQNINRRITKAWDTLGVGESDVAHLVEETLKLFPKSNQLEVGYRAHMPYVEVKISCDENQTGFHHETLLLIEQKLKAITVARNFDDVATIVTQKLAQSDFTFYDFMSQGYLHSRLSPSLKNFKRWSFKQSDSAEITPDFFESEDHFLALLPLEEFKCLVIFSINGRAVQKIIEAPMKSVALAERRRQYFSEMALVELTKSLTQNEAVASSLNG